MHRRRQALGAVWDEHRRTELPRSLRAAGPAYKPAALRSLDVCLDSRGPFIDTYYMEPKTALGVPALPHDWVRRIALPVLPRTDVHPRGDADRPRRPVHQARAHP